MDKKGQAAFEYLILTAFILFIIVIIFGYSFFVLVENSKVKVALSSARTLAVAADQVSMLGPGNSVIVKVELPDNVSSAEASAKHIAFRLAQLAGTTDVVEYSVADITPVTLPSGFGTYRIKVEAVDQNVVLEVV